MALEEELRTNSTLGRQLLLSQTCGAVLADVKEDSVSIHQNQSSELHENVKVETSNTSDVTVLVNEDLEEEDKESQRKKESFEKQPYESVS